MRVAALYEIHGNLPALEAVLEDVRRADVDLVVVGGDVLPGPMPRETLACLLDLEKPVQFIQGNGDREVRAPTGAVPESFREAMRWNAQQLLPEHERLIDSWPATLRVRIGELDDVLSVTPHLETTMRYLPVLLLKTASYRSLQDSTCGSSSAVIPICSLTARSEMFAW